MADDDLKIEIKRLLDNPGFEEALKELQADNDRELSRTQPGFAKEVVAAYDKLCEPNEFEVGQLIEWKPGMKNRKFPRYSEPIVVIEILDEPVDATAETNTPYFREKLDIAAGVIGRREDFLVYHFAAARFMPYVPEEPSENNSPDSSIDDE